MQSSKILVLALFAVMVLGIATAPADTGCIGSCGDDGTEDNDPESSSGNEPLEEKMCIDGEDNDSDGNTDVDDYGCVRPINYDWIEGNIWDTDLTNVLTERNPTGEKSESVFWQGTLHQGNDNNMITDTDTSSSGPQVTEFYVKDRGSETNNKWGFGEKSQKMVNSFPDGTVTEDGRVVDPPNPDGSNTCGDGIENEGLSKIGNQAGSKNAETNCRMDYGRVNEIYNLERPLGQDGLTCGDDTASATATCTSSTCGCGTNQPGSTSCSTSVSTDRNCRNDDYYFETTDQKIERVSCSEDDGKVEAEDSCDRNTCSSSGTCSCGQYCTTTDYTSSTGSTNTCTAGDERSWDSPDTEKGCNKFNVVDGGGDEGGNADREIDWNELSNIKDNDPSGTYTDFKSYEDDSWGQKTFSCSTDNDNTGDGAAWCGYESTLTVDADGPRGLGDGLAVVHNAEVVSTMSPDGSDNVGQQVYVDGSEYSQNYVEDISTSCPSGKTTCIRYVDFYTQKGEKSADSGDEGEPAWDNVDEAVQVDSEAYTADQGYSVCKKINQINEQNGNGQELIDCDFERASSTGEDEDENGQSTSIDDDSNDISPLPQACGDEPEEHLIVTEGNEILDENTQKFLKHSQRCVDWGEDTGWLEEDLSSDACVFRGRKYSEGTVITIDSPNDQQYERGDESPDREVCLDLDETGIDMDQGVSDDDGEYLPWDNEGNILNNDAYKDYGGEWYDLDNEVVNDYLRNEGSELIDNGDINDEKDIAYFWGENPNPEHSTYNPVGEGEEGIALEDDCGPHVECDDTGDKTEGQLVDNTGDVVDDGLFYSFFSKRVQDGANPDGTTIRRDEDFNETGKDQSSSSLFIGYMNKLKSKSDQLEQDEIEYSDAEDLKWVNSMGTEDQADQWAITKYLSWSISNRGVPYPPGPVGSDSNEVPYFTSLDSSNEFYNIYTGQSAHNDNPARGTYYHYDYDDSIRRDVRDDSVQKDEKVFGNSFAAVADQQFEDEKGDTIMEGEGVWVDPDDVRDMDSDLKGDWEDKIVFNIDITGPDSGLGFNVGDDADLTARQNGKAVYGDVYFEGEADGTVNENLHPPMCGDDTKEFLLEEIGESVNSAQGDGRYACASRRNVCVHRSSDPRIVPVKDYRNTGEPMEYQGRLKNDEEVCVERDTDFTGQDDNVAKWWDQDWGWMTDRQGNEFLTCETNSLYGTQGVRWYSESDVREHPYAFTGGIDDDWNEHLKRSPYNANESVSDVTEDLKNLDSDQSPVPTGSTPNKSIATVGFCGGDDDAEYFVTQQCNSDLCETKRDIQGVSSNPEGCVFDGDEAEYPVQSNSVDGVPVEERSVYQPGDTVTLDPGNSDSEYRQLTCFDNTWYRDFPVVFSQEDVDVPLGGTERVAFQLINVRDSPRTFDVNLEPGSEIYTFSSFDGEQGDSFQTTVSGDSSETYRVEIRGGNLDIDASDLTVEAEAVKTDMFGEDTVTVDVVNSSAANGTVTRQEPESVPGVAPIQLIVLIMMASAMFFIQS